jgi:ribosomal protein S18 acetylase RimI-like enzyme
LKITYDISKATVNDVNEHLLKCKDSFYPPLDEIVDINDYAKKIVHKAITFECWSDGKLIGLVACYLNDLKNISAFITNVSVIEEFKGRAIASNLMDKCITHATKNNFSEIILEVGDYNLPAMRLYKKFNFIVIKENNNLITMRKYI